MLKGILFDLDGTLVDSLRVTFDGFNHVFQSFGHPARPPKEIMTFFGPGERKIFETALGLDESQSEKAEGSYFEYTRSRLGESPLFDGVAELLKECETQNLPVSIVTGRGKGSTEIILRHHGLWDRFVRVICHEDVSSSKPSPEGIQIALSAMGIEAKDAAYVGDMWMDVRAAHRAGCTAISATWDSVYDRESVDREKPHHFVNTPRDLYPFVTG